MSAFGDSNALDMIVRTVLAEAGREGPAGWQAVANVIKNRVDSGAFGANTKIEPVLRHPKAFSTWANGLPARDIQPSDPNYQRVAQIVEAVFSGQLGDNTGGANHFYAPSGMPGGQPPDWAVGQNGQKIGSQMFYKLPLGSHLAPTGPAMGGAPTIASSPMTGGGTPIQSFTGGDYGREATAAAQPFKGIVVHVTGKPTLQSELAYSSQPDPNRPGYYGYHYLVDRDGKVYQAAPDNVRTNHIMPNGQYGLNNSNSIGVAFVGGDKGTTPEQMAAGKALVGQLSQKYGIDPKMVISHGELDPEHGKGLNPGGGEEGQDFITAFRGGAAPQPTPAPLGQGGIGSDARIPLSPPPVVADARPQQDQGQQQQPRGPDPNARFQVLEGMTTGGASGGRNPMLYTAANFAPGAGSTPPPAPTPAPTPAAPVEAPKPAQDVPLDKAPQPPPRPPGFGQADPWPTSNAPMWPTPPQPPQQTSMLPGSMTLPGQNLLKLLFG